MKKSSSTPTLSKAGPKRSGTMGPKIFAGSSSSSSSPASGASASTGLPLIPALLGKKGGTAAEAMNGEACAICLHSLNSDKEGEEFTFPCGGRHRIHFGCAMTFLGWLLSVPFPQGGPMPLTVQEVKTLGTGFSAIDTLFGALMAASEGVRKRVCCPLCRGVWPVEHETKMTALKADLQRLSARRFWDAGRRLGAAITRGLDRLEAPRRTSHNAVVSLERNMHSASTFFACHRNGQEVALALLGFLGFRDIGFLSSSNVCCREACLNKGRLRVPYLVTREIRTAMRVVSAQDVVLLEHVADSSSTVMKIGNIFYLDAPACVQWLSQSRGLSELTIANAQWQRGDAGGRLLAAGLLGKRLRTLDLTMNSLTDEAVKRLADALIPTSTGYLETLHLNLNCITGQGLAALLPLSCALKYWGLRHNKLGDGGCRALAQSVEKLRPGTFDLRTNNISKEGCKYLVQGHDFGACVLERMVVARLGCNPLGCLGVQRLAEVLGTQLQVLDLMQTKMGNDGAAHLGRSLSGAVGLKELLLQGNLFEAEGVLPLAIGWSQLPKLEHVDLSNNMLGPDGVGLIAGELPFWVQSPLTLHMVGVGCDNTSATRIRDALERHDRRHRRWNIDLSGNDIRLETSVDIRRLLAPAFFDFDCEDESLASRVGSKREGSKREFSKRSVSKLRGGSKRQISGGGFAKEAMTRKGSKAMIA
eukprot:TRINITY_DN27495_c0_g1_i2.p1 TRINITY_DN27495_c0_g1~~TRINITY_DN27495_c0_g1_i2.p1  ORF type:complete len:702 (+),score=167.68 TRINITY_DN27495_c0_g1_i2:138-2243(+)